MLEGIRVVELTHLIAGPYCGRLFADHGADVVKIEPPNGELSRHRDPVAQRDGGTVTAHFASMNFGKRSLTLDLKTPAGHDLALNLLSTADVVVSNMRPAALERLGLDLRALCDKFPSLIAISITGFGVEDTLDGERDRAGLAVVAEALSGVTNLTKDRNHQPVWCGFALGDMMAGATAYSSALAAMHERGRTGRGRFIDLALVDTILPLTGIALAREQLADANLAASASKNDFHGVPYGVFAASDGYVSIGANTNRFWLALCQAMERPDLASDAELATFDGRSRRMEEVMDEVERWTSSLTREQITVRLGHHDIPVAAVTTADEVLHSERYRRRAMLRTIDDGLGGNLILPSDATERGHVPGPVPRLGQHNEALAAELLHDAEAVLGARSAGAFGPSPEPSTTSS